MSDISQSIGEYNEDSGLSFDIQIPDIPIPEPEEEVKTEVEDKVDVAFKFAFIGAGQGGSRIAETFHKVGYRKVCAINTAQQDLNTLKSVENKLCFSEGGAGKDPFKAAKAFTESKEDVLDFMRRSFGDSFDRIFVCVGGGGGTGTGTMIQLVDAAIELQETLGIDVPVGLILSLPKKSEGKKVNANAATCLGDAYDLVEKGKVSPLILIDNEKITKTYPRLAISKFWETANMSVAGVFHLYNLTASKDSTYTSFDSNDLKQVLDSGLIMFGATPVKDWGDQVSLARAVRDNVKKGVLSGGVEISTGNSAGVIVIGGKEQLDTIPESHLDQAFEQISRLMRPNSVLHRGVYAGDKSGLTVFTMIGGLGSPSAKIKELEKLGDVQTA
tara:strand:+ start:411 stop:1568 length:1158 start_codon:yes stop_codon:yes gene_type:complete